MLETKVWLCGQCGKSSLVATWLAIDLVERPDLRSYLAGDAWVWLTCGQCGGQVERSEPLLVTRLAQTAPILMVLPESLLSAETIPQSSNEVLTRVQHALGDERRDVPGPILIIPIDVAQVVATRDVDRDSADPDLGSDDLGYSDRCAVRYLQFLQDVAGSSFERRLNWGLDRLRMIRGLEELTQLFAIFPELGSDVAGERLRAWVDEADDDEERHVALSQLALRNAAAAGDYVGAWRAYEVAMQQLWQSYIEPCLSELTARIDEGLAAKNRKEVIEAANELVALARAAGAAPLEAFASLHLADALYELPEEGRHERLERAIELYTRVSEIYEADSSVDSVLRSGVLMNLGAAYAARLVGDPSANQHRAIEYDRQAISLISLDLDGHGWALAKTNLGLSLLELARDHGFERPRDNRNTSVEAVETALVEEAINHLSDALQWRSFARGPFDWAFTELNLGLAYNRRQNGDRDQNLIQAIAHSKNAAEGFEAANVSTHQAQALHNLSAQKLALAQQHSVGEEKRLRLLGEAAENARLSVEMRSLAIAPLDAGRTWGQLAAVLVVREDPAGAIAAYQMALQGLTPSTAPRACRDAARELATLASVRDDWILAAQAWETAAEAAASATDARATHRGRLDELRENLNIFRFATYALTRAGRRERAVELLELGRGRELRVWLQHDDRDIDQLQEVNPRLHHRFIDLQAQLDDIERRQRAHIHISPLHAATISESLAETIVAIRALPGFEHFRARPKFHEIAGTVASGEALVYIASSPDGVVALIVTTNNDGPVVKSIETCHVTSTDLVRVFVGFDAESGELMAYAGYLVAHQQAAHDAMDAALAEFGQLLGRPLLAPLEAALRSQDIHTISLIPSGLLGLLPLHAITWEDERGPRCLVEEFDITFAPSAFIRSVCRRRATRPLESLRKLVVVGNPLPHPDPLRGAEREAAMVAEKLPADEVELLVGAAATKEAVMRALPHATHVHFACHAHAAILGQVLEAGLSLSRGDELTATEILELNDFNPRLVVASACETAVIQGYETADESLTIGSVFIGAGAIGVVATLWAVDDYATALFMSRFYELLAVDGESRYGDPAKALRQAQLWLRDLTADAEELYLDTHPMLRRHRHSSRTRGYDHPDSRPFKRQTTWAPFIFTGA